MKKIRTGSKLPPLCLPVALLGANVRGRPNFLTIAWFTMLQEDPPLIAASMDKKYYTRQGIEENKTFSLNIPLFFMPEGPYLKTGNVIAQAFDVGKE